MSRRAPALGVVALCLTLFSCYGTGPLGPSVSLSDVWVEGTCSVLPDTTRSVAGSSVTVVARHGSSSGLAVKGLSVSVNDVELEFDESRDYYTGELAHLSPGSDVTLVVSGYMASTSATVRVPGAPYDLELENDVWDVSSPMRTNQLSWHNPDELGEDITVAVYDYEGAVGRLVYFRDVDSQYTQTLMIYNAWLDDYYLLDGVYCVVSQVSRASLEGQPVGSEMIAASGVAGLWPVGSDKAGSCRGRKRQLAGHRKDGDRTARARPCEGSSEPGQGD